jgi:ABC-type transport system involved in multi-copper enzyme maturation permease subunit
MARLLAAELRRIAARRLVRLTVVLALVGIVGGGVAAFAWTGTLSEATYQQRLAEAQSRVSAQDAQIDACLQAHGLHRGDEVPDAVAEQCFPRKDVGHVKDPRFHHNRLNSILQGVAGALAVIAWAIGASLVGAEFASRGMTTMLTWETRRGRVFAAKAVAALLAMAAFAFAVLVLTALAMWPALALHGAPLQPGEPTLWSMAGTIGRGVGLATIAAGMGFAIASIGRNTAAALGAGFAYIIVLENILGSSVERWRKWLLLGNVIVLVSGQKDGGDVTGRTVLGAAVFLTLVGVGLLAVACGAFQRRDLA